MPDRVICAIKDPEREAGATRFGAALARHCGAKLVLARILAPGGVPAGLGPAAEQFHVLAVRRVRERLETVAEQTEASVPTSYYVEIADPAQALLALSRDPGNLLVLGARGLGPVRTALLGSVSRAVARQAGCPIIILPPRALDAWSEPPQIWAEGPIVCGIDGSAESEAAARLAGALAKDAEATLLLAHSEVGAQAPQVPFWSSANPTAEPGRDQSVSRRIHRRAEDLLPESVDREVVLLEGHPGIALCDFAEACDAGLVAVGSRGHGIVRSALLGSTSTTLAERSPCPVLICPESATAPRSPARWQREGPTLRDAAR